MLPAKALYSSSLCHSLVHSSSLLVIARNQQSHSLSVIARNEAISFTLRHCEERSNLLFELSLLILNHQIASSFLLAMTFDFFFSLLPLGLGLLLLQPYQRVPHRQVPYHLFHLWIMVQLLPRIQPLLVVISIRTKHQKRLSNWPLFPIHYIRF
jgi:hypothetical protein